MPIVDAYLARACAARALVAWPALAALVVLSQAARLGHRMVGAGCHSPDGVWAGATEILAALALGMAPAGLATAPLAAGLAALWALGDLRAHGEIDALRTAGASKLRLAAAPLAVGLILGLASEALLLAAPPASRALQARAAALMARATARRVKGGMLVPLGGDAVALFRKDGVLLHRPPITIAAREARLDADGGALRLRLAGGELHAGAITRAPLGALDTTIDLRAVISPHLRFLEDAAETAPLWAPALALGGAAVA
ncbi:MAG: LptF/LptG family permease, partial [Myxococcota bacterium]